MVKKTFNNYILIKEIATVDEKLASGLILTEGEQQEEQVAQGLVLQTVWNETGEKIVEQGDIVLFHKMIPVDGNIKKANGDIEHVWFVKKEELICQI